MRGAEARGARPSHPLPGLAGALPRARGRGRPRSPPGPPWPLQPSEGSSPARPARRVGARSSERGMAASPRRAPGSIHPAAPGRGRTRLPSGCSVFYVVVTQNLSFNPDRSSLSPKRGLRAAPGAAAGRSRSWGGGKGLRREGRSPGAGDRFLQLLPRSEAPVPAPPGTRQACRATSPRPPPPTRARKRCAGGRRRPGTRPLCPRRDRPPRPEGWGGVGGGLLQTS